jgi:hypothetical protein
MEREQELNDCLIIHLTMDMEWKSDDYLIFISFHHKHFKST